MPNTKTPARNRLPRAANGQIELLLIQSVDHLGKQGEVVTVRRGYAMNDLLPQGLATIATEHHKRMVEKHKTKLNRSRSRCVAAALSEAIGAERRSNQRQRRATSAA
jgi:large subunit ribosomal protein L9